MESELVKEKGSFSLQVASDPSMVQTSFFAAQAALRILAFALAFAAICVMVTSRESVSIFGIQFTARYDYSSAFKFLLGADAAACALSLLSLLLVCVFRCPKSDPNYYLRVFLHDMVVMVLMMAGCAAATAIGYVGRYGQDQSGWMAICDRVTKFCNRVLISILLSYTAFICFFLLAILSANKLKSRAIE